ncbi:SixA phosphatase family protein [Terrarubrum flagellatum]|uniref:SixA phosphatase family protein n=1 Tax=Terrirubrum flagellatum TaxID=2895980 RepID=UPI003144F429
MRRLILLRHAKSDWPQNTPDHDRPLAARGRDQAPLIGRYLAEELITPDLAIVSTARRAQETWSLVKEAFPENVAQRDEPRLFAAAADLIIALVQGANSTARTIICVGHNPGFHDAARMLTGHGDRYAFSRMQAHFPTCAFAVIDFDIEDWAAVAPGEGRLDRFLTPKMLGGEDAP